MYIRGTTERWGLYDSPGVSIEHPFATLDSLDAETVNKAIDEARAEAGKSGTARL
jgi:hypothetical protein